MTPYWSGRGVVLYHGDSRQILPTIEPAERVVVTDPVWPNAHPDLRGADDPLGVFRAVAEHFPRVAGRAVIQMGSDSDPRFLGAVPASLPFVCARWIRRTPPGYKGTLMIGGDVAYVFGHAQRPRGARIMPAECDSPSSGRRVTSHPCPRGERGVSWLLRWFVHDGATVLDPFAGSGTTLLCALRAGLGATGIEVDERWCAEAARRLDAAVQQGVLL